MTEDAPIYRWCLTRSLAEEVFGLKLETDMILSGFDNRPDMEVFVYQSPLIAGGDDQVWIDVEDTGDALALVDDPYMLSAVRLFNLGLVQKSPCLWARYHCLDLADRLIE